MTGYVFGNPEGEKEWLSNRTFNITEGGSALFTDSFSQRCYLNFIWSIYRWVHLGFTIDGLVNLLTAFALMLLAFYARAFAVTVQDRVIRLEERLRLEKTLAGRSQATNRRIHRQSAHRAPFCER